MSHFKLQFGQGEYAIVEKEGKVEYFQGKIHELKKLEDLATLQEQTRNDVVFLNPYSQIKEKGFEAHGAEPILAMEVYSHLISTRKEIKVLLSDGEIELKGPIEPSISDEDFAFEVTDIKEKEIACGNAAQVIFSRRFAGQLENMSESVMHTIFKRLLDQKGQYMTFLFSDGKDRRFAGATPERHLTVTPDEILMTPIAGTLKKVDKNDDRPFEVRLIEFLKDDKEINEILQVADEELKLNAVISSKGGDIVLPPLREAGGVIHTEFDLRGHNDGSKTALEIFRETQHAPTLVGSPLESAARITARREGATRGYYGGEIGIYRGIKDLDSAIFIRSGQFFNDGRFHVRAGAGIVMGSDPKKEAEESRAKAEALLRVLMTETSPFKQLLTPELAARITPILQERMKYLNRFLVEDQSMLPPVEALKDKRITIINNEDNFAHMIAHMLRHMGCQVTVVDTMDFDEYQVDVDLVVVGPGPGDINDMENPRMRRLLYSVDNLRQKGIPLFGVCLGHQALARSLDIPVEKQDRPTQGEQRTIRINGREEKLGFYNSFSPVLDRPFNGLQAEQDDQCRLMTMKGDGFIGVQFHPESVMSQNGYGLLRDYLIELTKGKK